MHLLLCPFASLPFCFSALLLLCTLTSLLFCFSAGFLLCGFTPLPYDDFPSSEGLLFCCIIIFPCFCLVFFCFLYVVLFRVISLDGFTSLPSSNTPTVRSNIVFP
ncbi:hypothetical protein L873DRAFT_591756, partial [Choiromyces venosus 120613-1]